MESNWRYNVWALGLSTPGPVLGHQDSVVEIAAELITPVHVGLQTFEWLIKLVTPFATVPMLGHRSIGNYVDSWYPAVPVGVRFPYGYAVHPDN